LSDCGSAASGFFFSSACWSGTSASDFCLISSYFGFFNFRSGEGVQGLFPMMIPTQQASNFLSTANTGQLSESDGLKPNSSASLMWTYPVFGPQLEK
jgi:hypothetical protein